MPLTAFQQRLLTNLHRRGVRVVVVGGQAIRAHGIDRATADLDLLIEPTVANATLLLEVLAMYDPAMRTHRPSEIARPSLKMQLHDPTGRGPVDILTSVDGVDFPRAFDDSLLIRMGSGKARVASLGTLLAIKSAAADRTEGQIHRGEIQPDELNAATRTLERDRRDIALVNLALSAQP